MNLIGAEVCDRLNVLYLGIWAIEAMREETILLLLGKLPPSLSVAAHSFSGEMPVKMCAFCVLKMTN